MISKSISPRVTFSLEFQTHLFKWVLDTDALISIKSFFVPSSKEIKSGCIIQKPLKKDKISIQISEESINF
jgi:hypothetical protein